MTAPRVVAVIQARLGSTRLPGKVLADVGGRPMLTHVVDRALAIPDIRQVVLATTTNASDDELVFLAGRAGIESVRGAEVDVLDRFRLAACETGADAIARLTADNPLLDPEVSGLVVREYLRQAGRVDYVSNVHPPTFPDGLDTEVVSREALETAWRDASSAIDREHVTTHIWRQPDRFRLANVSHSEDLSALRWTVDTEADLAFVRAVYGALATEPKQRFAMQDVLVLLEKRPELSGLNAGFRRNEELVRSLTMDEATLARKPRPS